MTPWYALQVRLCILTLLALYGIRGIYLAKKYSLQSLFQKNFFTKLAAYALLCFFTLCIEAFLVYYAIHSYREVIPFNLSGETTAIIPRFDTAYFYIFSLAWIGLSFILDASLFLFTLEAEAKRACGIAFFSNVRMYLFAFIPTYFFLYGLLYVLIQA